MRGLPIVFLTHQHIRCESGHENWFFEWGLKAYLPLLSRLSMSGSVDDRHNSSPHCITQCTGFFSDQIRRRHSTYGSIVLKQHCVCSTGRFASIVIFHGKMAFWSAFCEMRLVIASRGDLKSYHDRLERKVWLRLQGSSHPFLWSSNK